MPATKNAQNDVTTVTGFLAEFDSQVNAMSRHFGWCSARYAYNGDYITDGVPAPAEREQHIPPITLIDDALLSDDGKAAKATALADTSVLDKLHEQTRNTVKWGLRNGYGDAAHFDRALEALGMPDRCTTVTTFSNGVYVSGRIETPAIVGDSAEARREWAEATTAKIREALVPLGVSETMSIDVSADHYGNTVSTLDVPAAK